MDSLYDSATAPQPVMVTRDASPPVRAARRLVRFARRKPLGAVGGLIVVINIMCALLAPQMAPYGLEEQVLTDSLANPSLDHWLGTDELGRDLATRIIYGARTSVIVGFGAVAISTLLSITIGLLSGYYGGKVDLIMQRGVDIVLSFPAVILLISFISITGPGRVQVLIALGLWMSFGASRVVRSAVLSQKERMYVEAAHALGARGHRIVLRHLLPNVMAVVIVTATVQLGAAILVEASLSFLGYGVPPPDPSWGRMLSGISRQYMIIHPWLAIWPGIAIALLVFGFNMLGDALRDELDPRMRGGK